MPKTPSHNSAPLTDSPWFWFALFGCVAVAAVAAMYPKYSQRKAGIEQKFEGRQRGWVNLQEQQAKSGGKARVTPQWTREHFLALLASLFWPIFFAAAAVLVPIVLTFLVVRRQRKSAAASDTPEHEPDARHGGSPAP